MELKFNLKWNGCIFMEAVLKICSSTWWCWKFLFETDTFPCFFTWQLAKQVPNWKCSNDDWWNLKLSYLNQWSLLNHCHWNLKVCLLAIDLFHKYDVNILWWKLNSSIAKQFALQILKPTKVHKVWDCWENSTTKHFDGYYCYVRAQPYQNKHGHKWRGQVMPYLMSVSHKEYQTITFSVNERDTKNTSDNCDAKNLCTDIWKMCMVEYAHWQQSDLAAHTRENLV
jgi:hypothetical protein